MQLVGALFTAFQDDYPNDRCLRLTLPAGRQFYKGKSSGARLDAVPVSCHSASCIHKDCRTMELARTSRLIIALACLAFTLGLAEVVIRPEQDGTFESEGAPKERVRGSYFLRGNLKVWSTGFRLDSSTRGRPRCRRAKWPSCRKVLEAMKLRNRPTEVRQTPVRQASAVDIGPEPTLENLEKILQNNLNNEVDRAFFYHQHPQQGTPKRKLPSCKKFFDLQLGTQRPRTPFFWLELKCSRIQKFAFEKAFTTFAEESNQPLVRYRMVLHTGVDATSQRHNVVSFDFSTAKSDSSNLCEEIRSQWESRRRGRPYGKPSEQFVVVLYASKWIPKKNLFNITPEPLCEADVLLFRRR